MGKPLFLRWALINVLFIIALIVGRIAYHGHVRTGALIAISGVLATYLVANVQLGISTWEASHRRSVHARFLREAIALCPMIAMLGTVSGFLIAFTGDASNVQQRVAGASTGLTATFVGIASTAVLMLLRHVLTNED